MKEIIVLVLFFVVNSSFSQPVSTGSIDVSVQYNGKNGCDYYFLLLEIKNDSIIEERIVNNPNSFKVQNLNEGSYTIIIVKESCFYRENIVLNKGKTTFIHIKLCSKKFLEKRKSIKANCDCQHNDILFKYHVLDPDNE